MACSSGALPTMGIFRFPSRSRESRPSQWTAIPKIPMPLAYVIRAPEEGRVTIALCIVLLAVAHTGCSRGARGSGAGVSSAWPAWQKIEATQPPSAWRVEEASLAFDAWEAMAVVRQFSTAGDAAVMRFDDQDGGLLELRLAALPASRFVPALSVGDTVRVTLIRREGFEGVAQGLTVFDRAGQLLFLYDDGGYGSAFFGDESRAGLGVERRTSVGGEGEGWAAVDVTFRLGRESVVLGEGEHARINGTPMVVAVVVSREWAGPPMTDVDPRPLAYLAFHAESE